MKFEHNRRYYGYSLQLIKDHGLFDGAGGNRKQVYLNDEAQL